ncbi:S-adenosyl-L-methionine-dependent methyltransferase [Diplogelasinospora grovesii]|uniref:S-adenosyl-L-methionine-dependent methyltransferase n=1 Tax=Diplogelasinospora grovesii TaxID=303347 RepID=A0AAN6N281_9PEZI|nr:S-adenosyl-L-methionine-dependent methyltransferase [Diplogelasinospora grovesii]
MASQEFTFRNFTPSQAAAYSRARSSYPPSVIDYVISQHTKSGGGAGVVVDVGCGPGNATRDLAPHFDMAYGLDPGAGMVATATAESRDVKTKSGKEVLFRVCPAEEIDRVEGLEPGTVDLITAATAAHWFDMPKFWAAAAKALRPGTGTVAIWTRYISSREPRTEKEKKYQDIITRFREDFMAAHATPGNAIARGGYVDLPMPWDEGSHTASLFERDTYIREEREQSEWEQHSQEKEEKKTTLKDLEELMATMSSVNRWRAANPELAGTDKDCVKVLMSQLQAVLGGNEDEEVDIGPLWSRTAIVVMGVKRTDAAAA